ncbi:discoidin domain-containing protein [Streptomyces sp. RY43-2]|uniref:Discoidin domain-containing protein n=1 Tax=Streptomyces macrolidinus TaxID=2952607 RepID=A0ABT0ZK92_9ACTN|nr:discoidin domain-containing protein [Streptomyces macrolidinus]MCN9243981.1 discoidin domain-containing protein [Streptomyces macrolidinus]
MVRLSRVCLLAASLVFMTSLLAGTLLAPPPISSTVAADPPAAGDCGHDTDPAWALTSTRLGAAAGYDPYVGNGYLTHRVPPAGAGYAATGERTGWPLFTPRYDGAFVSGLYGREKNLAGGREVIAALPSWTTLDVRVGNETYGSETPPGRISHYRQTLFLRCGLVRTSVRWTTSDGRATDLVYEVLTDRSDMHTGAVRLRMTPHWNGTATVTARLDPRGARRIDLGPDGTFRTRGTGTAGAIAQTLRTSGPGAPRETGAEALRGTRPVRAGRTYTFEKYVGVDTALTSSAPRTTARAASRRAARRGWPAVLAANATAWRRAWAADISVPNSPDLQTWLRSAQYGLLTATRADSRDSIPPAGLTSDDYAGLVFWDAEIWMHPGLLATRPELARPVAEYRYRTRTSARANARKLGYRGLFYPWTSASRGDLWSECHSWNPPHCLTQIHLQGDIAFAAWQYYLATGDRAWLAGHGWPLLRGIADFWVSRVTANADGSYSLKNVAGPDEYSNGVTDGAFTNAVAATALRNAARAAHLLGHPAPAAWTRVANGLRIPYDPARKLFLQYAGYRGSMIKQADAVLLLYPLEWPMEPGAAAATLAYYAVRTDPDGPALADSIHAITAATIGEAGCVTYTYLQRSVRPFMRGPYALFSEARGTKAGALDPLAGEPAQDFLAGKGGFLQVFTNGLTGLRLREDGVRLDPLLPPQLGRGVTLTGLRYRDRTYDIAIGPLTTTVRLTSGAPFTVHTPTGPRLLTSTLVLSTRRPDLAATTDAARCRPATATSETPGLYAAAAVDGSPVTSWAPAGTSGALTVDLGRTAPVTSVEPEWTDARSVPYRLEISATGTDWRPYRPGATARLVRLTVTSEDPQKPVGVRELRVTQP